MTYTVEMDNEGKVQVPEPVRSAFHLRPGSRLVISEDESQASGVRIVLSPVEEYVGLRLVEGAWVIDDDRPITSREVDDGIEQGRSERESRIGNTAAGTQAA
jgi:bifunctional DNA-binding transcriptional regulator/antitoxin component of YhaV-PrlF toxin-antitoxin module